MNAMKKVLVSDDEHDIVEIIAYNLSKQNLEVYSAYSGTECISAARRFRLDLIVMDIRMPETNGIEACRIIKHDEKLKKIPILFLTADTDKYTAMSAMMAGGDHCINKPIRISILTEIIKNMLPVKISYGT